ncbi:glycoside hydrolase family 78 protein [Hyunsoonleella ulvae]|uniref:glycoside hydrolase family 78 protein n=1 Tax=Hyunsoonleella ulvae TaxID=2799948 RepID=UPI00193AB812|nr:family 16 glycoside hydrolase [Hyunsoonleella ulvae]
MEYLKFRNIVLFLFNLMLLATSAWATEVLNLKCNGQVNPTGIIDVRPEFSWTFIGDTNSPKQGGYRIMMATSIEKLKYPDIWDTGPTSTSETGPFEYCGEPLKSGQRIYWKVTAWGNNRGVTHSEPAWFEMGHIKNPETPFQPYVFSKKGGVVQITLSGNDIGRTFEGIGGVSAGASTDLLYDYENPVRSEILDLLFKPKFGAGFQHLKVEMGGGENSTCGSEPSHAITRDELKNPVSRGYEFWLMKEAHNRNPNIILEYLPWSFPYYLKPNIYTDESAEYFVSFLDVAKKHWGLDIDWVAAAENENYTNEDWLVHKVRPLLDKRGYTNVKIQGPDDNSGDWKIFNEFEKNKALNNIVEAVGYHYVTGREFNENMVDGRGRPTTEKAKSSGKSLWASEDWSWTGKDWGGAGALNLARIYNKFYIRDRITKTLIWAPIGSIYKSVTWDKAGAMKANSPWSGYYEVWPTIWATAHTTQFVEPHTWQYLNNACGLFEASTYKGSCVTLKEKGSNNWSMIICTENKEHLEINIGKGLSNGKVNVWKSDEAEQFIQQESVMPQNGILKLTLEPKSIYSLTTTSGQQKGTYKVPTETAFPFPYSENYENREAGDLPKYHSDQTGSFEIALKEDGSQCLKQIVPEQGYDWMRVYRRSNIKPNTLIGDVNWKNYTCSVDVFIKDGNVELGGRATTSYLKGYRFQLAKNGEWKLMFHKEVLESGRIKKFKGKKWNNLKLTFQDKSIEAFVNGKSIVKLSNIKHKGYVMLASSYDENLFDNLKIIE